MTLSFLTPWAALVGLLVLAALGSLVVAERRSRTLCRSLGLRTRSRLAPVLPAAALAAVGGLLALAAAQPVVATVHRGEARTDAVIAMTLSIIVIMAYIWLRFGNLRYGTATVIALLHDAIFTLAAIGMAHYIANTFIGEALLIEPFRINLTLIAAILTVMGWSMNDTVVVFDRIRENRGKFGHIDRQIVNDSINQTLSRTIITSGLTFLTVLSLLLFGGEVLKSFSWALAIGIVVGTYSTIYIAGPVMLWWDGRRGSSRPLATGMPNDAAAGNAIVLQSEDVLRTQPVVPGRRRKKSKRVSFHSLL